MTYQYIIVEDQLGALKNLQMQLKKFENFKEIGVANSVTQGISLALKTKPHLIFLDVELGEENGFDLIKEIRQFTTDFPAIIMATDFDKYAKNAVNTDVLYFLDKPILQDELAIALNKFEKKYLDFQQHITIKNSDGHYFLKLDSICYIAGLDNCCKIYRHNQPPMIVTKTLKEMESILPTPFLRIHKSYIVNATCIEMLNTTKRKIKLLESNPENVELEELPIGESYLETAKNVLLTAKIH